MTTEREMLDRLHMRFPTRHEGNGPKWAVAEHVKYHAMYGNRIADFMAQSLWRSGGYQLQGFEIKCSRSDWLTELRDPTKAEAFKPYVHRWWLVVSDKAIVRDDLPEGWGLLVPHGRGLKVAYQAPMQMPLDTPLALLAGWSRAVAKTSQRRTLSASVEAIHTGVLSLTCERFISPGDCVRAVSDHPCPPCRARAEFADVTRIGATA